MSTSIAHCATQKRKAIPAGHGSVEKELGEVFDHSESVFAPNLMTAAGLSEPGTVATA